MFWKNNKKLEEENTLSIIKEYLQNHEDKLQKINEYVDNNEELSQKSLRLQYKSNQEITKKFEQLNERLDETEIYKKKYSDIQRDIDRITRERNILLGKYIQWLDDIDLIDDKLTTQGQEYWISLLGNWQNQIISALAAVGIFEIDIIGKEFNPAISESVGTKNKEENKDYKLYEVVEVLQRGFVYDDGTLLRKAKVITIEELEKENNEE